MRKLTGRVVCKTRDGKDLERAINKDAKIQVRLIDCSRCGAPSIDLAGIDLTNVTTFPFTFEITYDETPITKFFGGNYAVSIRIETNGKLDFINDTRFEINDKQKNIILDHVDMHVIPID